MKLHAIGGQSGYICICLAFLVLSAFEMGGWLTGQERSIGSERGKKSVASCKMRMCVREERARELVCAPALPPSAHVV